MDGNFHADFGTNAVAPKFRCNGSVDKFGTMNGFVPVRRGASEPCPLGGKIKQNIKIRKQKMN